MLPLLVLLACHPAHKDPQPPAATAAPAPTPRSPWGHSDDQDLVTLLDTFPALHATRLGDCQTCHCGGRACAQPAQRDTNPCDWCHSLVHPDPRQSNPASIHQTLNPYGLAYLQAGRDGAALESIGAADSDGDGVVNADELAAGRYPGDGQSRPGQPMMPMRTLSLAQIQALPMQQQPMLANAPSEPTDRYTVFAGARLRDVLVAAGVPMDGPDAPDSITAFSPDGYRKEVPWTQVAAAAPAASFYAGLDVATLGERCGFVAYPPDLDLAPGAPLPPTWTLLAWRQDGADLQPVTLDTSSGRIREDGPLRLVVPQAQPGPPDRGSKASPSGCDDGHDYDNTLDHNAGAMVRGVVGIRVNPVPAGYEELDWVNGGWAYINTPALVVYGWGVTTD